MEAKYISTSGSWKDVLDCARVTSGKESNGKEPSFSFKKRILLAEHSPIRLMSFRVKWTNLLSWVSVHIVRHKIGIEHFVRSQRTDRTGIDRNNLKQSELIEHEVSVNVQALINISRKRLCSKASPETREAWEALLNSLKDSQPEIISVCVPECIYRGFCPEFNGCGYIDSKEAQERLKTYREV